MLWMYVAGVIGFYGLLKELPATKNILVGAILWLPVITAGVVCAVFAEGLSTCRRYPSGAKAFGVIVGWMIFATILLRIWL
jgi:hypothetical protein